MRNQKEVSVKKWGGGGRRIGVTEGGKSMFRVQRGSGQYQKFVVREKELIISWRLQVVVGDTTYAS